MVPHPTDSTMPSRTQVDAEPDWRLRCLLAQSLLNHRRTADGLDAATTELVSDVLNGVLD